MVPADSISGPVLFMASVLFRLTAIFLVVKVSFRCSVTVTSIFSSFLRFVCCYKGVKTISITFQREGPAGKSALFSIENMFFFRSFWSSKYSTEIIVFFRPGFSPIFGVFLPALCAIQKDLV